MFAVGWVSDYAWVRVCVSVTHGRRGHAVTAVLADRSPALAAAAAKPYLGAQQPAREPVGL